MISFKEYTEKLDEAYKVIDITMKQLIKFAGGENFLKKKFDYSEEIYDYLHQKQDELIDDLFKKYGPSSEALMINNTVIGDYASNLKESWLWDEDNQILIIKYFWNDFKKKQNLLDKLGKFAEDKEDYKEPVKFPVDSKEGLKILKWLEKYSKSGKMMKDMIAREWFANAFEGFVTTVDWKKVMKLQQKGKLR